MNAAHNNLRERMEASFDGATWAPRTIAAALGLKLPTFVSCCLIKEFNGEFENAGADGVRASGEDGVIG